MARAQKRAQGSHVRYSEKDKIKAVTALRRVGQEHMLSYAAIEAARGILGENVSLATLARWAKQYGPIVDELQPTLNPASIDRSALVLATQNQVIDQFMGIRDKSANILNDEAVLKQTANKSARDLAVVMGIAQTHLSQMTALPPESMQAAQRFYRLCEQYNEDFVALLEDMYFLVHARHNRQDNVIDAT